MYFNQVSCALRGNLDESAFKRAWQEVLSRHSVLRTAFIWERRVKPLQVVYRSVKLPWEKHDWRGLPSIEQQERLDSFLQADRSQDFDLSRPPLVRLALIHLDEDLYRFIWSAHHLLLDGWSTSLLLKEILDLYESFRRGAPIQKRQGLPYSDYIAWLQQQDRSKAETFWRAALKGFTSPTPLRIDGPTDLENIQEPLFSEQRTIVSATPALRSLARQHQLTLNTLVQGVWALLLSRYSGEEDVIFGGTVSGRPPDLPGAASMVGIFINTLPVRVKVPSAEPVINWLKKIQGQQIDARQYEYSPLVDVQGWSEIPRGLPLFESIFVFENYPIATSVKESNGDMKVDDVRFFERNNYPLTVVAGSGTEVSLRFSYDRTRFESSAIGRMIGHYQELMKSVVMNPEQRIRELRMIGGEEERELVSWNERRGEYEQDQCLHELFEEQAERRPEQIALVFGEEELTYGELNGRANQLAHYLRRKGVGAEDLVGLLVERSLELVVSVLGILKAGAAYVPLDPENPGERLGYMMGDAGVKLVLSEGELVKRLPEPVGAEVVSLEEVREEIAAQGRENVESGVVGANAAYVIYTSGSSGKPKGVVVSHGNVTRLFAATREEFEISEADVWTLFHSYGFDFSVWEIWGALLYGGRLVVVPRWVSRTPGAFADLLREARVTVLNQTPSAFRQLLGAGERAGEPAGKDEQEWAIRLVIFGGEALERRSLAGWYERPRAERVRLVNMYGITETTVHVTSGEVERGESGSNFGSRIGEPLADMEVYVLDEQLGLAGIGIAGELYVGGAGLARGYLNRAELTGERFIPHPYSRRPGARLYRTGDKGRYLGDGQIEFLGRLDQQVKIRGYRIELGEVEAALQEQEQVREALVELREDGGEKRLVAYIVSAGEGRASVSELREYLRGKLPAHMVPSAFVLMAALPLTPNGKVNRKALPAPEQSRPELAAAYLAPRTAVEEIVAGIWAQVLQVERVGVQDNFFELGGHSLLATQVISRVREACGVEVGLRRIFESGTVAGLAESVEEELKAGGVGARPALARVSRAAPLPLSFAQQRLWFLDQLEPGSAVYNVPAAVRLEGELQVRALEETLSEVVRRHEVLRTSFAVVQGEPVQVIGAAAELRLPLIDLRELPESEREAEAERLARAEAERPFELGRGPLLRASLVQLSEQEHLLLFTMHHIISDGWSMGVLVREVTALYRAYTEGAGSPLEELSIQYADYAAWQRQWLSGEVLEQELSYWREQLRGAPAVLELPTDRARPSVQTFRGAAKSFTLNKELSESLKELSRREGVTLFMTLLAAFQVLLWRYTGATDIVVGAPIANRNRAETESLIGFFVNTLVLRTDLSGGPTFRELLQRVREVALGAYAHQDIPFEMLVEELRPEREMSHTPLFQVLFTLLNVPMQEVEWAGVRMSALEVENRTSKFDLTLGLTENEKGLVGTLEYNTDLYDAASMERLAGRYERMLSGMIANVDQQISAVPWLSGAERQQIAKWSRGEEFDWGDRDVVKMFEEQVERAPEHAAIVFEGEQLSYRELNERANQLAHYLIELGVRPEVKVGLLLPRSVEMVIAVLGVLKAGAAYLPLELQAPLKRQAHILEDAQVPILLTRETLSAAIPAFWGHTIFMDGDWEQIAQQRVENPDSGATPENLAYMIYTSGSTGRPKGALITRGGLANYLCCALRTYPLSEGCGAPVHTPLSFDLTVTSLFTPLLSGRTVYLLGEGAGVESLVEALQGEETFSLVKLTPSHLELLRQHLTGEQAGRCTRALVIGGEALSQEQVRWWREQAPGVRLYNEYGPTETVVGCCVSEVEGGEERVGGVSIGRPIGNTQLHILDEHMEVLPDGLVGEIYIGGQGVGRGYWERVELTAERYLPDPHSESAGARLYRTGDLARYLPDGNIEFLGRMDQQVKLRGYRIELGEIEAVLGEHPAVRETVIIAREDAPGEQRLVAYIVAHQERPALVSELREYLLEKLPKYMAPSAFVLMAELPLTPNGKVNRKALPAPEQSRPELAETYAAPRTAVEEIVAGIWAEVLRVEQVGVQDNFFELGGHSLLATQVISRVREVFGIEVTLRLLFERPTVAGLAERVAEEVEAGQAVVMPGIAPVSREGKLPLSFAQQRLWFLDQLEPGSASYNVPVVLRLDGDLNVTALERTLAEVVQRHEILRTTFSVIDGEPVQVIGAVEAKGLQIISLCEAPEREREEAARRLASEEAQRPFDLSTGPLLRTMLLKLSAEEHLLLFTMHHIISDGWSMSVLTTEVKALYEAFSLGEPSPLEDLAIQYADYAAWQREWLSGAVLEQQLSYWREQLHGAPAVLELPTDRARPSLQSFRGAVESFTLGKELSKSLKELSQREGVTLFMTLLAAFQVLLSRYTNQSDIVVGSPIANRTHAETEGLIGFFINALVLRTDLSRGPTFVEVLKRVREVALGAYAHQDIPFEKLVEELQPERSLSHAPLFQVMFAMQNAPKAALEFTGLKARVVEAKDGTAKFDLSLALEESEDGLAGGVQYNTDLFNSATISRLANHFQTLLEAIAAGAEQRIADLPLLTAGEEKWLVEWNETERAYPQGHCIHQLFEAQTRRTPDAIAVIFEDQRLTYGELNERATRLAHHLQGLGVGPEVLVGLMMERSIEMLIGLLGILKAGGAFVPLDPAYPRERLALMLDDARLRVIVINKIFQETFPARELKLVCLDSDWETIARASPAHVSSEVRSDNLAYVLYTSGSTGKPKGVQVPHSALVNFLTSMREQPGLPADSLLLAVTSLSFDIALLELLLPLIVGARVELISSARTADAAWIRERIRQSGATAMQATPVTWQMLVEAAGEELSGLKALCGGEALSRELANRLLGRGAVLWNLYGPTETTIWSTIYKVEKDHGSVSIGRPIANTQIYVLDEYLNCVPVGVTGELYIGGVGVARGYVGRAAETSEKFIPDPFSEAAGMRLYRTGDLARYWPDGNLEFLGRMDQQVKIRGHRIELGEIEAALGSYPGVQGVVVLAREEETGSKRLVAYVVSHEEQAPTVSELGKYLKQKLPEYMMPSAFMLLDELPLTPNGKIDRKALPAPEQGRPELAELYVAPQTAVEEIVGGIWAEVLQVEQVGVHDNFFELGGHSLLATQVISRVREAFGVEVALRQLFERPTVAGLAQSVEEEKQAGAGVERAALARVSRAEPLPLSFAQQRLWFLDQLEPGSTVYNMATAVRLEGQLNLRALEQTLRAVVERHEILRTSFSTIAGEPVQEIGKEAAVGLPLIDLSEQTESEREAAAERHIREEAQRPFELASGPLLRATLLKLSAEEHLLLLTMHHIITDGWSMGVLVREVTALYGGFTAGEPAMLEELAIQYADYAAWQRQWLRGEVLEQQLSYWREQLHGAPAVLELPTDYLRPAVLSFRGAVASFTLNKELSESLKELSRREGVTLFMTLLAAFQVLLSRYTNQSDIVVGSPIANRAHAETEGLIGFFVNTLALRTDLSGVPTFRELLKRVREVALGAYAHQEIPFEKLVEELQPERALNRQPLFQVMLVMQNAPRPVLELGEVRLSGVELAHQTAKFDLTLELGESAQGLRGTFEYNTDLFAEATIRRLVGHWEVLLGAIVKDAEQRITELPLLTAGEEHELLLEWNETARDYPADQCLHQLFEEQVERAPEQAALVFEGEQLSYRELNGRANQLAHHLQGLGVGPEVLVGVMMERSVEMVVAVLGILKAGGAYVPLDPEYPQERLSFMLEDANISVLVTQARLALELSADQVRVVCLDSDQAELAHESAENPVSEVSVGNLAYVIYTSGSTGQPKGVLIRHQGVCNVIAASIQGFDVGPGSRVLQLASLSFDASVLEMWLALLSGSTLYLVNQELVFSGVGLTKLLSEQAINLIALAPSLLDTIAAEHLPELSTIIVGGETCSVETAARWSVGRRFFNAYAPTEATIYATAWEYKEHYRHGVPVGEPIANTETYILDSRQGAVPVGVAGEIHIGGVGVARGYLNHPDLTAERFIPHPFSTEPGARLYRTGDLARYLPDGNIEFLGRSDHQVKIRGHRIELGEIEAVLGQHPDVFETVVVAREEIEGDKQLVAYVVLNEQPPPAPSELRGYLKEKLPQYMIPSAFLVLEKMPLTANGKVDRKALPAPDANRPELAELYVAPGTAVEEIVAGIWAEVLKLERIGIYDNFFELGGHSLLATQIISRAREAFQVELPLRQLFEQPTVAGLSLRIEEQRRSQSEASEPPLNPVSRAGKLPLSFAQERLWFLDQLESGSASYNAPVAMRLEGRLNDTALEQTLTEVVRRHEILRTTFPVVQGEPVQVIGRAEAISLPIIDLSETAESEREAAAERLTAAEAQRPFDLSNGPLLRATLLKLSSEEHLFLFTMHHIIGDGWSVSGLAREVTTLYEAFARGDASPFEELAIQYADYAVWQRQWLQGEVLARQLAYWREQLRGAPAVLELPTDRARPAVQSFRGAAESFVLTKELSERLKELSRREGVTLFMSLLAAFQVLLSRYANQSDVVVGSPIANRTRVEVEPLIGFFVNTLALRTDLSGAPTFHELLKRVREVALGAYAHQQIPFEKLVEELQPERNLSHAPLFQVMFVLQNAPSAALELAGLSAQAVEAESATSKFDLTLVVTESADGLSGALQYNTDLFDSSTITRMAGHWQVLLAAIAKDARQRITELPLLTAGEEHELLVEWNETARAYPEDKCIHELFEEQVERAPEQIALVFADEQVTYRELNNQANQLAHYLRELGVERESTVGIYLERSIEMVVALLAVLKAGGAYVPLDPEYPAARLTYILADTAVSVVLTQQPLISKILSQIGQIVCLDSDREKLKLQSQENLNTTIDPEHLAYIIHTSGSTGQPKGVMVKHAGLPNLSQAQIEVFGLTSASRILQFASLSFDAAIFEIVMALRIGATLQLASQATLLPGSTLTELLRKQAVTTVILPPSVLAALPAESFPELQTLIVAGEACSAELAAQWSKGRRFFNGYGPTETTVCATISEDQRGDRKPPIGRAIANMQVYVLDTNLQPAPIGVVGEAHIGGVGLARGYHQRAELTAERFLPHPFSSAPGARLYRTGDLARYLPDGNLEFVGRLDQQVKIRGYRIELGEIEAVLSEHPAVRESVILAREDSPGDKQLVAYLVAQQRQTPTTSELRQYLKERLPKYMIPSVFMLLDELPLTPNGKVDRKALPAPVHTRRVYEAPRTKLESILTSMWEKMLNITKVGIHDDFFELGGNSLKAAILTNKLEEALGEKVRVVVLFKAPNVAALASYLTEFHPDAVSKMCAAGPSHFVDENKKPASQPYEDLAASPLIEIQPEGSKRPFFCVHPIGGHVYCYADLARYLGVDQPFYGLQSIGLRGEREPHNRIADMAAEYVKAVQAVQPQGPYLLGGYSFGSLVAFEMAQQLLRQGQTVARLALFDTEIGNLSKKAKEEERTDDVTLLRNVFENLPPIPQHLRHLDPDERLAYMMDLAKTNNVIPSDFEFSQARNFLKVLRANVAAAANYIPQPYAGEITFFRALERPPTENGSDPAYGLNGLGNRGVTVHEVPGNHVSMFLRPYVESLAAELKSCLDEEVQ